MTSTHHRPAAPALPPRPVEPPGLLGRLGRWTATHLRAVLLLWLLVVAVFGAFAPQVQSALSGAGWVDSGSQSVAAREVVQREFGGQGATALQVVVHAGARPIAEDPAARRIVGQVRRLLAADPRVSTVSTPVPGATLSRDGRTAVVQGGAATDANGMVRASDDLKGPLADLATGSVSVNLTGDSALWSDFNAVNHEAMIRSEVLSWPVTMLVLVLAFGSLVAAGLPLMLTLVGLLTAAGGLVLATHIAPISIWALNFAMMFALALGIDYALFLVVRFRAALARRGARPGDREAAVAAVAETMATAGKAIAFSGVTVLVSLSTVLLVPSPAFRSMALGIMLAVIAVLAATLTLLPAVLGRLGTKVDTGRVTRLRLTRRRAADATTPVHRVDERRGLEQLLHRWGAVLHRRPWLAGGVALVLLGVLAAPALSLRTGMPSIAIVPADQQARAGYQEIVSAFGAGVPGTLQIVTDTRDADATRQALSADRGVAAVLPVGRSADRTMYLAVPTTDASAPATGDTIDRLRGEVPSGTLIGGAAAENHDLETVLSARTPLVFGLLIGLGFLLLLVALGSPLVALVGSVTNLASIAGAFGVAKLIFQDGHLSGLLNFEPQGFVDAWGPLFFGAMLTGVAMDYTLFLLSAVREHFDATGDPHEAMRQALRTSGKVVVAAAGVMVAVFLTFALSGPLAPKEMGVILAVAVFLDALLVRLVLLPVVLRVTGRAAWHSPRWLGRALPTVRFSH